MIYFDAAYIAKCYLNEPGADRVREVAYGADGLASCELARLEFASILKRHVREHHVTRREMTAILKDFEEDEKNGVWQWFGVTSSLVEKARDAVRARVELNEQNFLGDEVELLRISIRRPRQSRQKLVCNRPRSSRVGARARVHAVAARAPCQPFGIDASSRWV